MAKAKGGVVGQLGKIISLFTRRAKFSCGHVDKLKGKRKDGDETITWSLSPGKSSESVCPKCAFENAIKCCFCSKKIYPGSPVAVYAISSRGINWEVAVKLDEHQVIGCLRSDCCPSGGFFAGYWTVNGFQHFSERKGAA